MAAARWTDLAALIAAHTENTAGAVVDAAAVVRRLEARIGIRSYAEPDPSPMVTARRFARVHAAAVRAGLADDRRVATAVDDAIAVLSSTGDRLATPAARIPAVVRGQGAGSGGVGSSRRLASSSSSSS